MSSSSSRTETETQWKKKDSYPSTHPPFIHSSIHPSIHPFIHHTSESRWGNETGVSVQQPLQAKGWKEWVSPWGTVKLVVSLDGSFSTVFFFTCLKKPVVLCTVVPTPLPFTLPHLHKVPVGFFSPTLLGLLAYPRQKDINKFGV
jgi:hypothetical protein